MSESGRDDMAFDFMDDPILPYVDISALCKVMRDAERYMRRGTYTQEQFAADMAKCKALTPDSDYWDDFEEDALDYFDGIPLPPEDEDE